MMVPGYWMHETSGVVKPCIEAYLKHEPLGKAGIAIIAAYFHQWIAPDVWALDAEDRERLTATAKAIRTREDIDAWLADAERFQIDPL